MSAVRFVTEPAGQDALAAIALRGERSEAKEIESVYTLSYLKTRFSWGYGKARSAASQTDASLLGCESFSRNRAMEH